MYEVDYDKYLYIQKAYGGSFNKLYTTPKDSMNILEFALLIGEKAYDDDVILDIGGRDGNLAYQFYKMTGKVMHVLDVNKQTLEFGKEMFGKKVPQMRFVEADVHNIPLPDDFADYAYCSNLLEHILYLEEGIREIHRIVKREAYFHVPLEENNAKSRKINVHHVHFSPDPDWWRKKLLDGGFRELKSFVNKVELKTLCEAL